ncbi:MAG: transposase [Flavobacteriales bacterium]
MKNQALEPNSFFHYYNRGNNKEYLFKTEENYFYFLSLAKKYLVPIADFYSYCLLPNHFHFVLRIKSEDELPAEYNNGTRKLYQPFSNMFNAYTKAFNKMYQRQGSLFQEHPKRQQVKNDAYLRNLILYVNTNSSHHAMADYDTYPYSSYEALVSSGKTLVKRDEVLQLFGGLSELKECLSDKNKIIESVQDLLLEDED